MIKLQSMTPEEKKQWYADRKQRIAESRKNKKQEVIEWKREILTNLGNMIREDTLKLDDPQYQPSDLTLWKIHAFLKQGFSIIDIRDSLLSAGVCTEVGWTKLKKILFEKHISKIEDLGLDVFASQQRSLEIIDDEIRHLKKMRKAKPLDVNVSKALIDCAKTRHGIMAELTRLFAVAGVVGEKKKGSTTINILSAIPRPQTHEEKLVAKGEPLTLDTKPLKIVSET